MNLRIPSVIAAVCLTCAAALGAPITTGTLVREMVDLHRLGDMPDPFYHTVQFSSYDHRSTLPGGPEWFANSDGFGSEPVPNFEAVLEEQPDEDTPGKYLVCDVQGPGALVRQWTARIGGTLAVYLDGSDTPVWDGPAEKFFTRPYDPYLEAAAFEPELLEGTFYQRQAAYCPFPFARRCRVVWTGKLKDTHFYQLQVRKYEDGADVQTFRPEDLNTYAGEMRRTARILAAPDSEWPYSPDAAPQSFEVAVEPLAVQPGITLEGPAAIERLTLEVEAGDTELALRQTILHIKCDGFPWGQVQAPVGDFFGAAPGVNPYESVPFTVHPDGRMTCRYVMPFAKNMEIRLENLGEQPVTVRGEVLAAGYEWVDDRSMHFRARWRIDHDLHAHPVQDMPYLCADGTGVYVGSVTYVLNPNEVPSSGGSWWGEGDEKIFVDDDVQPSTFGTGSEDYYNYAWSSVDIFVFPYCGQPRNDGPANRGFVTNNRWHILDPLPFRKRLDFYMELFPHEENRGMAYGRIGYHYGRPGIIDDHVPITAEDVRKQVLPPEWTPQARGGARDSVFFETEEIVQGEPRFRMVKDPLYTRGGLFAWQPSQDGETLRLKMPVKKKGHYILRFCCAVRPGSGKFRVRVDEWETGLVRIDLNDPHRSMLRCFTSRELALDAGNHEVTVQHKGGPEDAVIGIDFLWLQER